ncbi:MAG: nitronate monooxygenase, partial [Deltaproteobacteria bacterium]
MSTDHETRAIALLWRPREITSAVVEAARRTRTRALFDLSGTEPESAAMALLQADAGGDAVDLKISPSALMNPSLEGLLAEMGINRVWIELHSQLLDGDEAPYLERIESLSRTLNCFPILTDTGLIARVLEKYPGIRQIALKGCEASGFVSTETTLTLFGMLKAANRERSEAVDLTIWGGVATPEAAAAFISAGAKGMVFESVHWLTDLVSIDDRQRQKISKLRPEHTDLTGLNLEVPCRLFNRGNSLAVKQLKEFAGSLCGAEIRDEQRRFFAQKIVDTAVPPLEARFDRDEILPLGVEASFAESFVRRYGSVTDEAIEGFVQDIETRCARAREKEQAFVDSPVAKEFGTRYPFVQGAMSWISDVPEFALKVAEAGSLPTIALGLMDRATLERKLGRLHEILGNHPYAVNIITLNENPHREAQLAWIRSNKPRFAVIAAGEPSHARDLLESGTEVIYRAPNEELVRLAFDAGVRYVICEGNEAGGHVGEHSTLTLAQIILDHKNQEPELFEGNRIILAGGICSRESAFMAAMLGADAVQMGTCYLMTKEIVQTGALTELYQRMIADSAPGGTVMTGEGTGLRVRSLKTRRIEEICSLEREFASGTEEESKFRQRIEALTAGSLLIAARGLSEPDGAPLDRTACVEQGQFMSGACAGILDQVRTLDELHRELAEGSLPDGLPVLGPIREAPPVRISGVELEEAPGEMPRRQPRVSPAPERERIAVTG